MEAALSRSLVSLLVLFAAGCPDDGSQCPEQFKVGEPCEIEELVCPFPGAECEDAPECVCANQLGGFYWECNKLPYCRCTCPCGKIAVNTCEALGCVKNPADPCPTKAAPVCAVVCQDAGPPEAGPDLPVADGGSDVGADQGLPDLQLPDLQPDQSLPVDLGSPDVAPDGSVSPIPDAAPGVD